MQSNWVQNILPKFTVCLYRSEKVITKYNLLPLKQNSSEGFTTNGFSKILILRKMPLRNFGHKHELQYLEKYAI